MRIIYPNNLHQKFIKFNLFCIVTLIICGSAFILLPDNATAQQDDTPENAQKEKQDTKYTDKAKDLISEKHNVPKDKLKVANEKEAVFQYAGKKSHDVKLIDDKGNIYGESLGEDGQELDHDALVKEDLDAKHAKYGKFEPNFFEKISKEPEDKPVKAILSLKIPYYEPVHYPDIHIPDTGSNPTQEQLEALDKKESEEFKAHVHPVIDSIVEKLKARGHEINSKDTEGILSVELSPKEMKEIQNWDEIDGIVDGSLEAVPALASARPASGMTAVNTRTINGVNVNGSGIKIAQIEVGDDTKTKGVRLPTSNPYLPMTNITQDLTYACPTPHDHSSMVAGIIKSSNLANTGVAVGASLWASGSCTGDAEQLWNRTSAAANNQNASAVNLSFNCKGVSDPNCYNWPGYWAGQYDGLVYFNHRTIVAAAGNHGTTQGGDGTGNTYYIANAYNVITVGSYDDKNNDDINDDAMSNFSSWKNPASYHNDREKPDVVASGSNITSTGYTANLVTEDGTSYAAPVVTGGSAALMQRDSLLKDWPEMLKALILATARNNIDGIGVPWDNEDSKDGFGGVDFNWADLLLQGFTDGGLTAGSYSCADSPNPLTIPMTVTSTDPHRVIFTWDVDPRYQYYSSEPNIDFDIKVIDPNNNKVWSASRWDGNVEGFWYNPSQTGTYTLVATSYHCDPLYKTTRYGAAWTSAMYKAQYYNNQTLSGTPSVTRQDAKINFDWGGGSPDPAIPSDHFSARWTKTEYLSAGTYEFSASGDDGIRLFIDGVNILDKWFDQGQINYKVSRSLTAGNHTIKFEYYENGGGASAKLSYYPVTPVVSGGIYRVVNQCSGKVLDVANSSTADGANVWQWDLNGTNAQRWKIEDTGGGLYKLTAQHSGKVLDADLWSSNVQQWTWKGGNNQKWSIINVGAGYSKLISKQNGLALDVAGSSIATGANVQQWVDNGSCAQRWRLDKL